MSTDGPAPLADPPEAIDGKHWYRWAVFAMLAGVRGDIVSFHRTQREAHDAAMAADRALPPRQRRAVRHDATMATITLF